MKNKATSKRSKIESGEDLSCTALLVLAKDFMAAQAAKDRATAIASWKKLLDALKRGKALEQAAGRAKRLSARR